MLDDGNLGEGDLAVVIGLRFHHVLPELLAFEQGRSNMKTQAVLTIFSLLISRFVGWITAVNTY